MASVKFSRPDSAGAGAPENKSKVTGPASDIVAPPQEGRRKRFGLGVRNLGEPPRDEVGDEGPNLTKPIKRALVGSPVPVSRDLGKGAVHDVNVEFAHDERSGLCVGRATVIRHSVWDVFGA